MKSNKYQERINELISLADRTLATKKHTNSKFSVPYVDSEIFNEFRSSSLSFILVLYSKDHPYYQDFENKVLRNSPEQTEIGRGILKSIKSEIEGGWILSFKGLISAEIFSDFLEMAEHLLDEKFKDAAAVMIGSDLEEHLKQLCTKNKIDLYIIKEDKTITKKADLLNAELTKATVYNALDQKM